jgi:putative aldouronate transport system permease protein
MMLSVAYPLSKSNLRFPGRNIYAIIVLFTMLFSGGLVPLYLWVRQLGLLDSIWALVLPSSVNVFLCIVLTNFFKNIPEEIEDAATIDGASHIRTLFQIAVPLSKPALATVTLFAIIHHWNSWFDGLIYMRKPEHYPYATYLRMLIIRMDQFTSGEDLDNIMRLGQRPLMMAYVIIGMIPIAVVYPFLQKYVKSGLLVGSVKG